MKGLWVKDLLLLQKQLKTFLIFMVIAAFNAYTIKSVPVIFIFMTFFFVTTAASTIFYDQENHGFLYLFTLPTRKKDYVIQKQLLILASSLVAVVASLILILLMMQFDPELRASSEELFYTALTGFFLGCLYGAIITPLYLRYGTEKARMLLFAIMGVFALVGILIQKTGVLEGMMDSSFIASVEAFNSLQITGLVLVLVSVNLVLSTLVSRRFIDKSVAF
jgi:4-hydroxybenzoate polyprenyltransferase